MPAHPALGLPVAGAAAPHSLQQPFALPIAALPPHSLVGANAAPKKDADMHAEAAATAPPTPPTAAPSAVFSQEPQEAREDLANMEAAPICTAAGTTDEPAPALSAAADEHAAVTLAGDEVAPLPDAAAAAADEPTNVTAEAGTASAEAPAADIELSSGKSGIKTVMLLL